MTRKTPEGKPSGVIFYAAMLIISHLFDTFLTDILSAVCDKAAGRAAEEASGFKFLKDDPVILHKDLQLVPLGNVERAPQLDGQYNSAQFVYLTNDTC
jgi:hypothetical protein